MLDKLDINKRISFALFCAKQVTNITGNSIAITLIDTVEAYLHGNALIDKVKAIHLDCIMGCPSGEVASSLKKCILFSEHDTFIDRARLSISAEEVASSALEFAKSKSNKLHKDFNKAQDRYYMELLNFDKLIEKLLGL